MSPITLNCSLVADKNACNFFNEQVAPHLQATSDAVETLSFDVNSFFLIWGTALVIFMHAGFAMLSAGAVRSKNAKNMLICITLDLCMCAVAWFLTGFGFAFGRDNGNGFIGTTFFVGLDVGSNGQVLADQLGGVSVSFAFFIFEFAFSATAATIVSGAVAERARFESYLLYSFYLSALVYPVVVHWVWGGGFLSMGNPTGHSVLGLGAADFAGDGPVHMIGGLAGAIASKIMGPRIGRFDPETGKPMPIPGHSSALANLGVFILWIGWLGFNGASIINVTPGGGTLAARAVTNTVLASACGTISALFYAFAYYKVHVFDFGVAMNGALTGLVSITASCAYVEMWAACVIGFLGGLVYVGSSEFVLKVLKIDDPLDATAVHYFGGIWGLLCSGIFANPRLVQQIGGFAEMGPGGFVYPGAGGALLACQLVEICVVTVWTAGLCTPLFLFLHYFQVLRVPADIEEEGLDSSHHGGAAYPEFFHAGEYSVAEDQRIGAQIQRAEEVQARVKAQTQSANAQSKPDLAGGAATDAPKATESTDSKPLTTV